jgi:hypothetical protein
MSMESMSPKRNESQDSPEIQERKATLDKVAEMSDEEMQQLASSADLNERELAAMKNWRDSSQLLDKYQRQTEVRDLYFAEKHPTLSRIMSKLNIGLDHPYDTKKSAELDAERDEKFSMGDFEMAIDKIQAKNR